MERDRFGNPIAEGLPYARGRILATTGDDYRKLQHAWRAVARRIGEHGPGAVYNFSGLSRSLPLEAADLPFADDEIAPSLYLGRLHALALDHMGGAPDRHDVAVFNRVTAAIFATHLALVKPGETVVGLAPTYSHPVVVRSAMRTAGRFVDTRDFEAFAAALDREPRVGLVVVTRLAVTYDMLPLDVIQRAIRLAHERKIRVLVDDAGGARVGPAVFEQPRTLDLGADVGVTGLDKYGTAGPRLGLLAGDRALVEEIRARGFEFGLEARPMLYPAVVRSLEGYTPARVRELVTCTRQVGTALKARLGERVRETPVTAQLTAEDILELAMARAGLTAPPVVPYEAKAALAMLLLEDYGVLSVHFAGLPPGTSSFLFKFIPPETLAAFGGAEALAKAVDDSLAKLARLVGEPENIRGLLFGGE